MSLDNKNEITHENHITNSGRNNETLVANGVMTEIGGLKPRKLKNTNQTEISKSIETIAHIGHAVYVDSDSQIQQPQSNSIMMTQSRIELDGMNDVYAQIRADLNTKASVESKLDGASISMSNITSSDNKNDEVEDTNDMGDKSNKGESEVDVEVADCSDTHFKLIDENSNVDIAQGDSSIVNMQEQNVVLPDLSSSNENIEAGIIEPDNVKDEQVDIKEQSVSSELATLPTLDMPPVQTTGFSKSLSDDKPIIEENISTVTSKTIQSTEYEIQNDSAFLYSAFGIEEDGAVNIPFVNAICFETKQKTYIHPKTLNKEPVRKFLFYLPMIEENHLSYQVVVRDTLQHRPFMDKTISTPTECGLMGGGAYFVPTFEANHFYMMIPLSIFGDSVGEHNLDYHINRLGLRSLTGFYYVDVEVDTNGEIMHLHDALYEQADNGLFQPQKQTPRKDMKHLLFPYIHDVDERGQEINRCVNLKCVTINGTAFLQILISR